MVVPYKQGFGEKFKRTSNKKDIQVHFKGSNNINDLLMATKDKDTRLQKSGVIYQYKCPTINCPVDYIGRLAELLRAGWRSTSGPPPPFTITPALQGIQLALIASTLFKGKHRAQPDILRRPCTSGPKTHHWTGTLANTNCHTYGFKFYRTLQDSNSSNALSSLTPSPSPCCLSTAPLLTIVGGTTICLVNIPCGGAILNLHNLPLHSLHPYSLVLVTPSLVSTNYLFI